MRYSISTLAVAASSLLVKDAFAGRFDARKRDLYVVTDVVIFTEEVTVYDYGTSTSTGGPDVIATVTSEGVPFLVKASSSTPVSLSTQPTAVFVQQTPKSSTPAPAPTSTTPVKVVVPPTTTKAAIVVPTTLVPVKSSAAPAPVSTSPGTTTPSSAKRGLAFNDVSLLNDFTGSKAISWAYNWGNSATVPSQFEFVPLLWGLSSGFTSGWSAAASRAIAAGSKHLMSFNEPDLGSQSNLSPSAAAAGYKQFMMPFAGKAQLGSPAVTNGGGQMGLTWLGNFLNACTGCQIDFVSIHWYNGGDAAAFMAYIDKAYAAGGNRPLWITEFQGQGDAAAQNAFLETVLPQLDASPKVARYAYFMVSDGKLVTGTSLNTLGKTFAFAG